jgi:PAS domain S-box-containing protein
MSIPLRLLIVHTPESDPSLLLETLRRGGYDPTWRRVTGADVAESVCKEPWDLVCAEWPPPAFACRKTVETLLAHLDVPLVVALKSPDDGPEALIEMGADGVFAVDRPPQVLAVVQQVLRTAEIRHARRRGDEALRESGERFTQAFTHAPIGMALVGIDGVTLHVNRALCLLLGYGETEMMGTPVWRITHPDDMPATIEQLQRLIQGESDTWHLEKRFFHRDGHVVWARSTTWLVRGPDGHPRYVVSQVQDITAHKLLEEQTRRQQAELAHVLRVATMGEMVAEIAHEINQPLASIANFANGLSTRLERGVQDAEELRMAAAQIASEAQRASDVIRGLRDFLRKGEERREWCDTNELVREAVRLIEPEARQSAVALNVELTSARLRVAVDRVQVAQVVLNLLRNAFEALAAGDGGRRDVHVRTAADGQGSAVVSVRDSGKGLPPAQEARIFDAFFTTKEGGLGLGLSISRSIIEAHGGRLWARPNDDQGTTVGFALPALAE